MIDLKAFRKETNIAQSDICAILGITQSYISAIETGKRPLNAEKFAKLHNHYGDIVLKHKRTERPIYIQPSQNSSVDYKKTETIPIVQNNLLMVPLVSQYSYASYISGYAETEYIESLPTLPFIVDKTYKGKYMCFEVKGDSMDDGSIESYPEHSILLCRSIPRELWKCKLHFKNWDFVIVHKTEDVVVKRIINHDVTTGNIICHSLNPLYMISTSIYLM